MLFLGYSRIMAGSRKECWVFEDIVFYGLNIIYESTVDGVLGDLRAVLRRFSYF